MAGGDRSCDSDCKVGELNYVLGILGMWIMGDGIISIRLYLNAKDETGKRVQSWGYDHSIRLIRCAIGIFMMVAGGINAMSM